MIHRVVSLTRNAWENVRWFFGILVCLILLVVLMPFVPVLRLYNVKHNVNASMRTMRWRTSTT